MPIFEYRCSKCHGVYEELLFTDLNKAVPCPFCGSGKSEKIPSVIGGITTGKASCGGGTSCASAPSCAAAGSGCCPHAQ